MTELIMRVTSKWFVAAAVWQKSRLEFPPYVAVAMTYDTVVEAAPIIQYVKYRNWTPEFAESHFRRRGFNVETWEVPSCQRKQ